MKLSYVAQRVGAVLAVVAMVIVGVMGVSVPAYARTEPPGAAPAQQVAQAGCMYWVRPGDTLYSIALRHGASPWYLAQANGLYNPNYIYAGMVMSVPCTPYGHITPYYPPKYGKCAPSAYYLVKPKDNLFRIAYNYGTTINLIRNTNGLWGVALRPGRTIVVPCPGSMKYRGPSIGLTTVPPPPGQKTLAPPPNQPTKPPRPTKVPPQPGQPTLIVPPTAVPPTAVPPPGEPTLIVPPTAVPPPGEPTLIVPPTPLPEQPTVVPPPTDGTTIVLANNTVNPPTLTIKFGQTVTWVNQNAAGGAQYSVVSGTPGAPLDFFSSGPLAPGASFQFKFDGAGIYPYYVEGQPNMTGQVSITP